MNSTVNLSQLITRVAKLTGTDSNTARIFVRRFFASIVEALEAGESVSIKDFGTFMRSDIPGETVVLFRPDETFAEEVNHPFSMFEAVELADDIEESDFATTQEESAQEKPQPEETIQETPQPEEHAIQAPEPELPQPAAYDTEEDVRIIPSFPEDDEEPDYIPAPEEIPEPAEEEEYEDDDSDEKTVNGNTQKKKKHSFWPWIILLGILAGAAVGYLAATMADVTPVRDDDPQTEALEDSLTINETPEIATETATVTSEPVTTSASESEPATAPTTSTTPAAPSANQTENNSEPVYETVSSQNYLSSMARRHYGAQIYWVYIYEANANKLGHPDRIAPGTRLVIPPKSSFPAASSEAEARSMAERKAAEIRARFAR